MKHSLQLRLSQHLTLTPQLQQSIRLLQLSTLELNQEIERLLQDNPLLEREDTPADQPGTAPPQDSTPQTVTAEEPASAASDGEAAVPTDDISAFDVLDGGSFSSNTGSGETDDEEFPPIAEQPASLRAHLASQLSLLYLSERDKQLVNMLIDSLNDDGYLPIAGRHRDHAAAGTGSGAGGSVHCAQAFTAS